MKSGDKFIYDSNCGFKPQIFTLQKLPDFDLWMLIDDHGKMFLPPMKNPKDAFGMWYKSFKPMIKIIYENGPCGNCPVQAEGLVNGLPFYFRSRGATWSLSIAKAVDIDPLDYEDCFFYQEDYKGKNFKIDQEINDGHIFSAGWAEYDECKEFIERAANILLNKQ